MGSMDLSDFGSIASITGLLITLVGVFKFRYWLRTKLHQVITYPKLYNFNTWTKSLFLAEKNIVSKINSSEWKPDVVVGIGRSGGIWGGWIAGNIGSSPFVVIDSKYTESSKERSIDFPEGAMLVKYVNKRFESQEKIQVLLVIGGVTTGHTLIKFEEVFCKLIKKWDIKKAAIYQSDTSLINLDYVASQKLNPWPSKFHWHKSDGYRPHMRRK